MPIYALGEAAPRIHPDAYVHPDAVLIGDVRIGAAASIWPSAVVRADSGPVFIGARTSIQDGAVLHTQPRHATTVGSDCVIGHLAHLEGCVIEDFVLVGSGAVVLERAVCRTISLVAAGAVVLAGLEVPTGAMAAGVPARIREGVIGKEKIMGGVDAYVHHAAEYRRLLREVPEASCLDDTV